MELLIALATSGSKKRAGMLIAAFANHTKGVS